MKISIYVYFIMELIEKSQRDLIGIDTFERGIVLATLLLRQGLRQGELETNKILIYQSFSNQNNVKTPNLTIDLKVPYDSVRFNGEGGDFLNSILSFDDNIFPEYNGTSLPPTLNNTGGIEDDHEDVDSLEKYLIWCISRWTFYNKQQFPIQWDIWGYLSFLEEARPPVVQAKVILPFDYEKYLDTYNLIASVKKQIIADRFETYSSLIGNNLFGNAFKVGN